MSAYSEYVPVPGSSVLVHAEIGRYEWKWIPAGFVCLTYVGTQDELVGAGVCTPEMLALVGGWHKKGPRTRRVDEDGDYYGRDSYFISRAGQPVRKFKLYRVKPELRALRLPGAQAAIEKALDDARAHQEWKQANGAAVVTRPAAAPIVRYGNVIEFPRARAVAAALIARGERDD